jgi:hypothetical protein
MGKIKERAISKGKWPGRAGPKGAANEEAEFQEYLNDVSNSWVPGLHMVQMSLRLPQKAPRRAACRAILWSTQSSVLALRNLSCIMLTGHASGAAAKLS